MYINGLMRIQNQTNQNTQCLWMRTWSQSPKCNYSLLIFVCHFGALLFRSVDNINVGISAMKNFIKIAIIWFQCRWNTNKPWILSIHNERLVITSINRAHTIPFSMLFIVSQHQFFMRIYSFIFGSKHNFHSVVDTKNINLICKIITILQYTENIYEQLKFELATTYIRVRWI